jgi:hypothetical protein
VDLGGWRIRKWRPLAGLTTAVFVVAGGLAGYASGYTGPFPALGGPNGLLYDLTLAIAQPWRQDIPAAPVMLAAVDDTLLASPELASVLPGFLKGSTRCLGVDSPWAGVSVFCAIQFVISATSSSSVLKTTPKWEVSHARFARSKIEVPAVRARSLVHKISC